MRMMRMPINSTKIPAKMIDKFIDIIKCGDVWRCRVKLKNGMVIPAAKDMTLNEYQLNTEARFLLYKTLSTRKNEELK